MASPRPLPCPDELDRATSDILLAQGRPELATQVRRFVDPMLPPKTEKERLAASLLQCIRKPRVVEHLLP